MDKKEEIELKPCPFCMGKPSVAHCEEYCCGAMPRFVYCECGAELHGIGQEVLERWNNRPQPVFK